MPGVCACACAYSLLRTVKANEQKRYKDQKYIKKLGNLINGKINGHSIGFVNWFKSQNE